MNFVFKICVFNAKICSHEADVQHSEFHKNVSLHHIGQRIMLSWRPTALHSLRLDWAETVNTLQSALQEVHQIPPLHSWDLTRFTPRWLHHKNVFVHQVLSRFEENVSKTRYLLFKLLNSFWIWCPQHRFCKSLHSVLTVYAASQRFWSRACKSQQGKMSCDPRMRRGKETLLCAKCKD